MSRRCAGWVTHEFVHFIANEHTMATLATAGLAGRDLSIIDLDEVRETRACFGLLTRWQCW